MHDVVAGFVRNLAFTVHKQTGLRIQPRSWMFAWLLKHAPRTVDIIEDAYNGRWRVISTLALARTWKSVSWTRRGLVAASALSLHHAWVFHSDATGCDPPWSLQELEAQFQPTDP